MTKSDERLSLAKSMFVTPPKSVAGQAEVAMYLKTELKLTRQEIANALGLSFRQTMARLHKFKYLVASGAIPSGEVRCTPKVDIVQDELDRIERTNDNREAKGIVLKALFEDRLAAAVAPHLAQAQANTKEIERLFKERKQDRPKSKGEEQALVAVMSDLHKGLSTHGHPESRSDEANENFVRRILKLAELHRQTHKVETIHLIALGDLIQGTANYANQRWDVTAPAIDQAEAVTQMLVKNIETFLVNFTTVEIHWGSGNHEYITGKKVSTDPANANWGTVMARNLKWAFRNNPRVKFHIPEAWYSIANILGSRFLLTHGHAVQGSGSFDGLVNQARKWADVLPAHEYLIMGHFHRLARLPLPRSYGSDRHRTLYLNGTAVESDDFLEQFGASPVSQWWVLFVNAKRGVTAEYSVDLYGGH